MTEGKRPVTASHICWQLTCPSCQLVTAMECLVVEEALVRSCPGDARPGQFLHPIIFG